MSSCWDFTKNCARFWVAIILLVAFAYVALFFICVGFGVNKGLCSLYVH